MFINSRANIKKTLPARHKALDISGVWVTLYVHQDGRGQQVRGQLTLLVHNVVRGIAQQWSVVGVEKHFLWTLLNDLLSNDSIKCFI